MANECGLEKLYNIIFWIGSLPVHANTYFLNDPEGELAKDTLSTLSAINAFLRAIALIADNFPNRATTPEEIMRALGMLRHCFFTSLAQAHFSWACGPPFVF